MHTISNLLNTTFKNELQKTDLTEKTSILLMDSVKAQSNLLKNINFYSENNLEVYRVLERSVNNMTLQYLDVTSMNSTTSSQRILIQGGEHDFKEMNGKSVFATKLEDRIREIVEEHVLTDFRQSSTQATDEVGSITAKLVQMREVFGDKEFTVALGLEQYLNLAEKMTALPIKCIYVPRLEPKEVMGFIRNEYVCNCVIGSVDTHKNIETGVCTVGASILTLESRIDNQSVLYFAE